MGRIRTISPTINQADRKLNGVIDAVKFKYKRMMDFVLEENDLRSNVFSGEAEDGFMPYD